MMTEAASTSETSVNYQTTLRNDPEDSHLHTRRRENLKSYIPHFARIQYDDSFTDCLKIYSYYYIYLALSVR
jgi:hypothetical protein